MSNAAHATANDRKAQLYLQHPDESPELIGVLPYLIHPPSRLSSSRAWKFFRDKTLLPMIRHGLKTRICRTFSIRPNASSRGAAISRRKNVSGSRTSHAPGSSPRGAQRAPQERADNFS
jgi:hypothetical protein